MPMVLTIEMKEDMRWPSSPEISLTEIASQYTEIVLMPDNCWDIARATPTTRGSHILVFIGVVFEIVY